MKALEADLHALDKRLGPDAGEVRALVITEDGRPGPLGKMVLSHIALSRTHRCSATEMAEALWDRLSDEERETFGGERKHFVARIKRWFQPSQQPYASLDAGQAAILEAAAAAIARDPPGTLRPIPDIANRFPALGGMRRATAADAPVPADPQATPGWGYVDPLFLVGELSLSTEQDYAANEVRNHLINDRTLPELLCLSGTPYAGKKAVLSTVIRQYRHSPSSDRPLFALPCEGLPYWEVEERLVLLLESAWAARGRAPVVRDRDAFVRTFAAEYPAIYVLTDLAVLPGNPAYRLITQQDDIANLIEVLLSGHVRTRVVVSCDEPADEPTAPSPRPWTPSGNWPISKVRPLPIEPPGMGVLLDAIKGEPAPGPSLRQYQKDPVDGLAVHLAAAWLSWMRRQGRLQQGLDDLEVLLHDARKAGRRLTPDAVAAKLWEQLPRLHRLLCAAIAASDDGLRESSLIRVLAGLDIAFGEAEQLALDDLNEAFNSKLIQDKPQRVRAPWAMDDLDGGGTDETHYTAETHYQFDRLTRPALLRRLETGTADERRLVRTALRLIAAAAREQAHHRRLNVEGSYGSRLRDVFRDVQCVMSLVASVDLDDASPATGQSIVDPIALERAVMEGRVDGRTTLRFAYLQVWRQDIDRDYRISTQHGAEELRFHVLIAIVGSAGRSFVPRRLRKIADYAITEADIERLRPVLGGELMELLSSLAISAQQIGAIEVVEQIAGHVKKDLDALDGRDLVLAVKIQRAWIDARLQFSEGLCLPELEEDVRRQIAGLLKNERRRQREATKRGGTSMEAASKQARLKLSLRLGEICHLESHATTDVGRVKRRRAEKAFDDAVRLEAELSRGEACVASRALISGIGARKLVRAYLDWAMAAARRQDWAAADAMFVRARDVHTNSLRRLTRHAADRAAVLLDEARIHRVQGFMHQSHDRDDAARDAYKSALALLRRADSLRLQVGMPVAVRLDLDGLAARTGLRLADAGGGDRKAILDACEASAQRLKRVADRLRVEIPGVHARLLLYRIRLARGDEEGVLAAAKDHELVAGLEEALEMSTRVGLGIYTAEIERFLEASREGR